MDEFSQETAVEINHYKEDARLDRVNAVQMRLFFVFHWRHKISLPLNAKAAVSGSKIDVLV